MPDGYASLGDELMRKGEIVDGARLGDERTRTREILGYTFELTCPDLALPVGTGRKVNVGIAAIEALQLVGGWSDPALTVRVAPQMANYMDAGVFHGAYGLRCASQVEAAIRRLTDDRTSRQALVTIWDPLRDMNDGPRDLPCTITLQWLLRGDLLHAVTYMRSNDFWWGLAYDAFQFSQLQCSIAAHLGVGVGRYHHHVGSFHAYERDWENIAGLTEAPTDSHPAVEHGLHSPGDTWADVRARTRAIATGADVEGHDWYQRAMAKYV